MRKSKEIRHEIAGLRAEIEAIVELVDNENRDLSDEEKCQIDEIQGNGDEPGKIARLEKDLERAIRFESRVKEIQNQIGDDLGKPQDYEGPGSIENVRVPARARQHGKLKAFENSHEGERQAFIAGHLALAGIWGNRNSSELLSRYGLVQNTMVGGADGLKGGFLVPDEMRAAIVRLREERGVFPRFANQVPMGSDNITIPRLIGDVTAYWTGEGSEITASDAEIGSAELTAKKLACLTKVSSELDQDAVVAIGDMITTSMAYAMADKIDEAGFNGDGTSTYGGVTGLKNALNANAIQDAATGNDSALELDLADFEATVGKYPQYPGASPRWFMHSAVFYASAARLQNAAGGNTIMDLGNGPVRMFMGYPVEFVQVMPSTTGTLASTIVAYFGDLRLGASLGTRQGMQTAVSVDRYFENDLIGLRCTERIAINVHERGDTVRTRPIVALKTAAS